MSPIRPLLASALLLCALTAQAGADTSVPPIQIALGEPSAAVHKALAQFDALSQYGGPLNGPTESYLASGLDAHFLRGAVDFLTVRDATPSLGSISPHKARQSVVSVKRVGAGDAVQVSIGETVEDVRSSLGL